MHATGVKGTVLVGGKDALNAFRPEQPLQNTRYAEPLSGDADDAPDFSANADVLAADIELERWTSADVELERWTTDTIRSPAARSMPPLDPPVRTSLRFGLSAAMVVILAAIVAMRIVPRTSTVADATRVDRSQPIAAQAEAASAPIPALPLVSSNRLMDVVPLSNATDPSAKRLTPPETPSTIPDQSAGKTSNRVSARQPPAVAKRDANTSRAPQPSLRTPPASSTRADNRPRPLVWSTSAAPSTAAPQPVATPIPNGPVPQVATRATVPVTPTDAPPPAAPTSGGTTGSLLPSSAPSSPTPSARVAPRDAVPAPPPAAAATVVPPPPPAAGAAPAAVATRAGEESAVRNVLGGYVSAYRSLNVDAAKAVWPSVDAKALGRAFSGLESQTLDFAECQISVAFVSATAQCVGTARFVPKFGHRNEHSEYREWNFEMKKNGERWAIARVTVH